ILPQQTHDDRFAVQHRNYGNANIDLAILNPNFDSAILRQAFLGDIQMTENFYAGNDRRLEPLDLRRNRNVLQYAVDAVTNPQFILKGFKVNVRSAEFDRVLQHLIDEADDRRILRRRVEVRVFLGMLIDNLERSFFPERVDRIGADPQS